MKTNNLYIACIDLTGKRCLVVGAGPVGLEKIHGLLAAGAEVSVVAMSAVDEVRNLAEAGVLNLSLRPYSAADLKDCFLAIAATADTEVNQAVHRDAESRSMLVNVADVPHLCNFILPAIVRQGRLAVAISTAGASPALAKRMKEEAAHSFGAPYAELAEILEAQRPWARSNLPTYQDRKRFFEDIVNGMPDPIELLRAERRDLLRSLIEARRSQHLKSVRPAHGFTTRRAREETPEGVPSS